jgi:hypothetical protein
MVKYYDINQGKFFDGKYYEPKFPLNKENIEFNLKVGTAKEITEEIANQGSSWGHGIYKVDDNGEYDCISHNWDSSG